MIFCLRRAGGCCGAVAGNRDGAFAVFLLASAISPRGAGVAPVLGGTYFSLQRQRKVGKRKPLKPQAPVTLHHAPTMVVAPERLSPRTFKVSDKGLIHPAARFARCGWVNKGNHAAALALERYSGIRMFFGMPHGARSLSGRAATQTLRRNPAVRRARRER